MSSFKISFTVVAIGFGVLMLSTSPARSADAPAAATPAMTADQKAQAEAWAAAGKPGPEHEWLKQSFVGDWDADVTFFGEGGSGKSKGVMRCKMILGDRYLQLSYDGSMDGPDGKPTPFKGVGVGGFDKGKKKYVNFWIDEMSTAAMTTEGTREGDIMTLEGQTTEPMSGQPMKVKEVITVADHDHHKYELYMSDATGKVGKVMEILYTRKG